MTGLELEIKSFGKVCRILLKRTLFGCGETLCNGSDVILDIGANVGIYSLIAKSENPNAKIIAFEPSRKIYPELIVNMDLNNFDIKCERIALSNSNKEQTFFDSTLEQFPTSGSLSAAKLKDRTSNLDEILEYTVVCTTLDDYVVNNKRKEN